MFKSLSNRIIVSLGGDLSHDVFILQYWRDRDSTGGTWMFLSTFLRMLIVLGGETGTTADGVDTVMVSRYSRDRLVGRLDAFEYESITVQSKRGVLEHGYFSVQ